MTDPPNRVFIIVHETMVSWLWMTSSNKASYVNVTSLFRTFYQRTSCLNSQFPFYFIINEWLFFRKIFEISFFFQVQHLENLSYQCSNDIHISNLSKRWNREMCCCCCSMCSIWHEIGTFTAWLCSSRVMAVKEWFRRLQPVQLYLVLFFTTAFFIVEVVASHVTRSLTLLLNAYHMLCNIIALVGCIASIKVSFIVNS